MTPDEKMAWALSAEGENRAREYLARAKRLDSQIALKQARLEQIRARGMSISRLTEPVSSGAPGDRVGNAAALAADLEREVLRDYSAFTALQKEIEATIRAVPDDLLRMVLEMRYLQAAPHFRIAMALHVEERHVYRLHRKALRHVALILLEEGRY